MESYDRYAATMDEAVKHLTQAKWVLVVVGQRMSQYSGFGSDFYDLPDTWSEFYQKLNFTRLLAPNKGHEILSRLSSSYGDRVFFLTTGIEGLLTAAGIPDGNIFEFDGSYRFIECSSKQCTAVWPTSMDDYKSSENRAPTCPICRGEGQDQLIDPGTKIHSVVHAQQKGNYETWLRCAALAGHNEYGDRREKLVVLEIGGEEDLYMLTDYIEGAKVIRITPENRSWDTHVTDVVTKKPIDTLEELTSRVGALKQK